MRFSSVVVAIGFVACSPVTILHVSDTPNGGIGFFPLIPVNQEVLQYQQKWLKIDINVNESIPVDDKTWKDATIVTSFFACGANQAALEETLSAVRDALKNLPRAHKEVMTAVGNATSVVGTCTNDPPLWASPNEIVAKHVPIGDQRTIQPLPATDMKYLNVDAPYGGSASADVKLDARGTLAEASVARQDQMPPAVAGAFGAVLAAGLTAGGSLIGSSLKSQTYSGDFINNPPKRTPGSADSYVTAVSITTTVLSRTYTLTTIWPVNARSSARFSDPAPNPCLNLESYANHTGDCIDNVAVANDATAAPAAPTTQAKPNP